MKPMDMDMYALTELHNFIRQNATPPIMTDGIQKESKRATRKPERMPNCQIGPLFPARHKGKKWIITGVQLLLQCGKTTAHILEDRNE